MEMRNMNDPTDDYDDDDDDFEEIWLSDNIFCNIGENVFMKECKLHQVMSV